MKKNKLEYELYLNSQYEIFNSKDFDNFEKLCLIVSNYLDFMSDYNFCMLLQYDSRVNKKDYKKCR